MKKLFMLFFALLLFFGLVGCDLGKTTTTTTTSTTSSEVTTVDYAPVFSGVQDVSVIHGVETINLLEGVSVTDSEDGDLTSNILVEGEVDLTTAGDYPIVISVTDTAGHNVIANFTVSVVIGPDEVKALQDIASVQLDVDNLALPLSGANGSKITWKTNRPDVITKKGYVIQPGIGYGPVTVTLTAKFVNGTFSTYVPFEVVVQGREEVNGVTSVVEVPFEGTSEEYVVPSQDAVKLFYMDNGNLPYIDIQTFINLISGAIQSDIIEVTPVGEDGLSVVYTVEYEDFDGSIVSETYSAYIDFTLNTFTVNTFDFFENYVADTTSDYGEGLNYVDAAYVDGNEVTIPLGYYNFDLVIYNDGETTYYLMPFHVTDLLFAGGVYYDVYYNGEKLWGIDTFSISSSDEADIALQEQIRTSSLNSLTVPTDIRWASYNFLALTMDYFYGLRNTYDVSSFYEILSAQAQNLLTYSDTGFYRAIFEVAYEMDDLHTSHVFTGYYEEPFDITLYQSDLGSKTMTFYNGFWGMQDLLTTKFGGYSDSDIPEYRVIDDGKTAIIYITGFTIDTPDAFKATLDKLPETVLNVVIDLSFNTGGNVGAVLRIFGYMTDEPIQYHSQNPADGSAVTYFIESDYVPYDYNWFILTSSVTFSAANLMTSMAKELGIATILGKNSSGGASSIGAIYTPDGSCLLISTNNVLSTVVKDENGNDVYVSVEDGVTVDYFMYNVTDDALLIEKINLAQNPA
ncbi:MAG: S41 family peptidase [Candidatus Izemoplasmatales bacterium]|jgi:hypothetical protein|nr:S41 family peptidase [Candidatus Izemoplasmatales bacterium]